MLTYVALVHTHMPRHVLGWEGWVRFPSAGIILIRCFGENRSHVAEANGRLKEEKKNGEVS